MKIIKSALSSLIVICILPCFMGCHIINNSPVWRYYNQNDKCLEVRSDNTWTRDGEYGLGHWKVITDYNTIEFTDFYGDIQKVEIGRDEYGDYIKFYNEYYYKDKYPSNKDTSGYGCINFDVI